MTGGLYRITEWMIHSNSETIHNDFPGLARVWRTEYIERDSKVVNDKQDKARTQICTPDRVGTHKLTEPMLQC
jgi:hypothetical protein